MNLVDLKEHNQTILMLVQQNRNATICSFRSNLNILTSQAKLAEEIDEAASMCDTDFFQRIHLSTIVVRYYMFLTDTVPAAPARALWLSRRTARLVVSSFFSAPRSNDDSIRGYLAGSLHHRLVVRVTVT